MKVLGGIKATGKHDDWRVPQRQLSAHRETIFCPARNIPETEGGLGCRSVKARSTSMLTALLNVIYHNYLRSSLSGILVVRGRSWLKWWPRCCYFSAWAFSWRTHLRRIWMRSVTIQPHPKLELLSSFIAHVFSRW